MRIHESYFALTEIYHPAFNLGRWRRALGSVSQAVEARAIALLIRRPGEASKDLQMLNSTCLKFVRSPWGAYYDFRLSRLQNPDLEFLSKQPTHQPTLDTLIGPPPAVLGKRANYAFLRKRLKIGRRLGVKLNSDKVWFDAMSIAFTESASHVPWSAIEETKFLLPHLSKGVEKGRTFVQLKLWYSAVLTALNRVKVGLAIALPSGDIIIENDEAKRILAQKDGLTKGHDGHLKCHIQNENAKLNEAIFETANTARGEENCHEWLIAVQRPSGLSSLLLDLAPLKRQQSRTRWRVNSHFAGQNFRSTSLPKRLL